MNFEGKLTEIREVKTGTTERGEWANVSFEVTESKEKYPQIGLFDFFKNGEYVKYAKEFKSNFKLGDNVSVEFNLKKSTYIKKDGSDGVFYSTPCWKIEKLDKEHSVGSDTNQPYDNPLPF